MGVYRALTCRFSAFAVRHFSERRALSRIAALGAIPALFAAVHFMTVAPGDTLSQLAQRACGTSADWTGIYAQNHRVIGGNPNLIYPGEKISFRCETASVQLSSYSQPAPAPAYHHSDASGEASSESSSAPVYQMSGGSFQACVIQRESGGDSQVMNASGHYGLYQFDYGTWVSGGGAPGDFGHASVAEQNRVFASVYAARGTQPWAPSDGC